MAEFIGVDVGGTKIATATLRDGELSESYLEPTVKTSGEALVNQFVSLIARTRTPETVAVGIGVPSTVEFATGRVRASVNIPLRDIPLREVLSERTGLPVFVDNDASCAALAEAHDDGGKLVARHLVMLTLGTGVGGGIVVDGKLYRGATGAAAELGHTLIGVDLSEDATIHVGDFPQRGSLEALAAGPAFEQLAVNAAMAHPGSVLGIKLTDEGSVSGVEVVELAQDGDHLALEVLATLGHRVGIGIANAINTFDPEEVVIGGGVSRAGELLLEPARKMALEFVLPGVGTQTTIRLARHGVQAGVLGAALIAKHETEGEVA